MVRTAARPVIAEMPAISDRALETRPGGLGPRATGGPQGAAKRLPEAGGRRQHAGRGERERNGGRTEPGRLSTSDVSWRSDRPRPLLHAAALVTPPPPRSRRCLGLGAWLLHAARCCPLTASRMCHVLACILSPAPSCPLPTLVHAQSRPGARLPGGDEQDSERPDPPAAEPGRQSGAHGSTGVAGAGSELSETR